MDEMLEFLKAEASRTSTDAGIERNLSDKQPLNADSPISRSEQPRSNVIFESDEQSRKQESQRTSIEDGIKTDRRLELFQ
jgi:hypothetical protein